MLQNLYPYLLTIHSWLRWIVLLAAVVAILVAFSGWSGNRPASATLRRWGGIFVGFMDLQLILGLLLYFGASPVTRAALENFGAAMKVKESRFFAVEHPTFMILALVAAHIGSVMARKGSTNAKQNRGPAIAYTISLLLVLGGMPWWRPLFRM
ncbi:MAG: hypothetical protein ACR2G0_05920 [Chthoniobacterales bacterium]